MARFFAKKTTCAMGHTHDSKAEARRCGELHLLLAAGKITGLVYAPRYEFLVNGTLLTMRNGSTARYTADFSYIEGNRVIVEDVKPSGGGSYGQSRDVPLRLALFRHCYPDVELRIVK